MVMGSGFMHVHFGMKEGLDRILKTLHGIIVPS